MADSKHVSRHDLDKDSQTDEEMTVDDNNYLNPAAVGI